MLFSLTLAPLGLALVFLLLLALTYRHNLQTTRSFGDEFDRVSPALLSTYKNSISPMLAFVVAQSTDAMILLNIDALNDSVDLLRDERVVESAIFFDAADSVLAAGTQLPPGVVVSRPLPESQLLQLNPRVRVFEVRGERLVFSQPFNDQGEHLGRLRVIFSLREVSAIRNDLSSAAEHLEASSVRRGRSIITAGAFITLLGVGVCLFFWRRIANRLATLSRAAIRLAQGDSSADLGPASQDEIGVLRQSFSDLRSDLEERQERLDLVLAKLSRTAYYDGLTQLPNRAMFYEQIEGAVREARRYDYAMALMFIDLDGFKNVNDTLGHDAGDELLEATARRLEACLRSGDKVAAPVDSTTRKELAEGGKEPVREQLVSRLGGDEFTVLLARLARPEDAALVGQRLVEALEPPLEIKHQQVVTTPSIGIALYPQDGDSVEVLVQHADTAMYEAKRGGKNRYVFYEAEFGAAAAARLAIEQRLRVALQTEQLELYYQPMVSGDAGRPDAVEALLRWTDDVLGPVSPEAFVAVAEETGLIGSLGNWVLRRACQQLSEWRERGLHDITMCVNVASEEFARDTFVDDVLSVLESTAVPPECLELEITERTVMGKAAENINRLAEAGVRMAIDDFGTGYSSLAYLKRFPVHRIKIDRRFVMAIDHDPDNQAITSAIVAMARSFGLSLVAEGVETEAERTHLADEGIDLLQGWRFARAMPAEQCEKWIRDQRASLAA